ncbi:unnamed protein product [Periconia digitata]|uniref:Digeranylgeranylglyceryl phosphate synthase n=1 Tax=Periconia digitata TaxID=1303443 RepID=A0A9W4UIU9_9PLEO|nr:unnamed protein product [Periconia digitata]
MAMFKAPVPWLFYHAYTLFLFTASDIAAVLLPQSFFAISFALSPTLNGGIHISPYTIFSRLPAAMFWVWLHLLVLDLSNQRRPDSVAEDKLNKPWRPIPSGRLQPHHARQLLIFSIPFLYVLSSQALGGEPETVALFVLNWIYNDLDAAEHMILRNILNALGITFIGAGATAVLTGESVGSENVRGREWLFACAGVLATTIQAQDLYDQEGDGKRGRKTMPLVLGDVTARFVTAGPVLIWSVLVPGYWRITGLMGWLTTLLPGLVLAGRMLKYRNIESDRKTFKLWACWTIGLYAVPIIKATEG